MNYELFTFSFDFRPPSYYPRLTNNLYSEGICMDKRNCGIFILSVFTLVISVFCTLLFWLGPTGKSPHQTVFIWHIWLSPVWFVFWGWFPLFLMGLFAFKLSRRQCLFFSNLISSCALVVLASWAFPALTTLISGHF